MESYPQGDSISRDVTSPSVTDFTGWTGVWGIFDAIGGTALMDGTLAISTDKKRMECRVPPTDGLDVLPIGNVYLEIQVSNVSLACRITLPQEKIKITAQSLKP